MIANIVILAVFYISIGPLQGFNNMLTYCTCDFGYYGQFRLSRPKAHILSLKLTRLIRTPVNTDSGHFSVSRVTNSHTSLTPLYGHRLCAHCLFSLSQLCADFKHRTLLKK